MTTLSELLVTGRTPQGHGPGDQRSVPVAETLERIRPVLPRMGVTRLANITGLDRIGIPVTLSIRPNGRVLSLGSGKGLTLTAALVSGAMEALELHHAEVLWQPATIRRTYEEIRAEMPVPEPDDLPLARSAPFPRDWPYRWVRGWDLVAGAEVALPLSMIHMGNRQSRIFDLFSFQITSNGLASGNNLIEAIHSGLLEVIERDATTCHAERWERGVPPPPAHPDVLAHGTVQELLERIKTTGMDIVVTDCTVDTRVPVFRATVIDDEEQTAGRFTGYGAHLDPEIAVIRAITEAVQAHTVTIAGSRDDLYRHRELIRRAGAKQADSLRAAAQRPTAAVPRSRAADTYEEDVRRLIALLRDAGLPRVVVVDLSVPWCPVNVVKVVVPGMEGYRFENFAPGRRAVAFARTAGDAA